jgi:hypothetical protein
MRMAEAVSRNVAAERTRQKTEQKDLAAAMSTLGHDWTQRTVAEVEGGRRRVSLDELVGLALALGRTPPELLSPPEDLDHGAGGQMHRDFVAQWARGRVRALLVEKLDGGAAFKVTPVFVEPQAPAAQLQAFFEEAMQGGES